MSAARPLPWQKEPVGNWTRWTITGGRGAGKSWALRHALIGRAVHGESVALFPHPNLTVENTLSELARDIASDFDLEIGADFQVSRSAGVISFRSGGEIQVQKVVESGMQPPATTVALDQVRSSALIPFRSLQRVVVAEEDTTADGLPIVDVVMRDAT